MRIGGTGSKVRATAAAALRRALVLFVCLCLAAPALAQPVRIEIPPASGPPGVVPAPWRVATCPPANRDYSAERIPGEIHLKGTSSDGSEHVFIHVDAARYLGFPVRIRVRARALANTPALLYMTRIAGNGGSTGSSTRDIRGPRTRTYELEDTLPTDDLSALEDFYPYFEDLGIDWKSALPDLLDEAARDNGPAELYATLQKLGAKLRDAHTVVRGPGAPHLGYPDFTCIFTTEGPVVASVGPGVAGLKVGDLVAGAAGVALGGQ